MLDELHVGLRHLAVRLKLRSEVAEYLGAKRLRLFASGADKIAGELQCLALQKQKGECILRKARGVMEARGKRTRQDERLSSSTVGAPGAQRDAYQTCAPNRWGVCMSCVHDVERVGSEIHSAARLKKKHNRRGGSEAQFTCFCDCSCLRCTSFDAVDLI